MPRRSIGSVFRKRYRDRHGRPRLTANWYIEYQVSGRPRPVREATPFTKKSDAQTLLRQRLGDTTAGGVCLKPETTFGDLETLIVDDYRMNVRDSLYHLQPRAADGLESAAMNLLYYRDNLDVPRRHVDDESVDLVRVDPPLKTVRRYLTASAALLLLANATTFAVPAVQTPAARPPDVGYQPSSPAAVEAMLKLAQVGRDDVVYDLGSGDGRIVIRAAQEYGARGVGIEVDPELIQISRKAAVDAGVADRVRFIQADLFTADISEATVVTLYLWPTINDRLEPKLRRELRPGTRVLSLWFPMGRWVPDATVTMDDGRELSLWTVPRRAAREPDVPFVPTEPKVVDAMLALADVRPTDVVFDLGSGDGRILIMAAQKYGARGVGIELDPSLVDVSRGVARQGEVSDRVTFQEADLFDADLTQATVVTVCLSADVNARLETKLRGLRHGARIVSRTFGIGNWPPDKVIKTRDESELFLWIVP